MWKSIVGPISPSWRHVKASAGRVALRERHPQIGDERNRQLALASSLESHPPRKRPTYLDALVTSSWPRTCAMLHASIRPLQQGP
jgi:hypothetical protein